MENVCKKGVSGNALVLADKYNFCGDIVVIAATPVLWVDFSPQARCGPRVNIKHLI